MSYQEYPKVMNHPQHQPATFKLEPKEGLPKGVQPGTYDEKPARFPPLTVHTPEQEKLEASRGYVPAGESDPEAYRRSTLGVTEPDSHVHREYPKWKYHATKEPVIVQNEAGELALGAGWANTPDGPFVTSQPSQASAAAPKKAKRKAGHQAQA